MRLVILLTGVLFIAVNVHAIGNEGAIDVAEQYKYVGALVDPGKTLRFCSGTLITPFWVLTARHCFIDAGHDVNDAIDVVFNFDPAAAGGSERFSKDPAVDVMVRSTEPNDEFDDDEISRDIALVRLDRPVKPFIVGPHHPTLNAGTCGDDWDGHVVGFGNASIICPATTPVRRFILAEGYAKSEEDYGAVYNNNWTGLLGQFCDVYAGHGHGDSGGPILKNSASETICGVASVRGGAPVPGPAPGWTEWNIDPAVDSQETIDWLTERVIDNDGHWDGECGSATPANDPDGDGIPTACDSCPRVYNPAQLTSDDDADLDSHGDACDFCPGATVVDQTRNCNLETELALAFPGTTELPVLRLSDFPNAQAFFDAKQAMLAAIRPDACDPVPCPRSTLQNLGDLPQSELPGISAEQANNCLLYGCSWEYDNRIQIVPQASPPILAGSPASTTGTTGVRWCQCETSTYTVATLAGRVECRGGKSLCVVNELAYAASTKWMPIVTRAAQGWTDPDGTFGIGKDIGRTWQVPIASPPSTQTVFWDFLELGGSHVHQPYPGQAWVKGVLWTHFESLAKTYPAIPVAWVPKFGNVYGNGEASVELHTGEPPSFFSLHDYYVCDTCPEGKLDLFAQIGNPDVWGATASGLVRVRMTPTSALNTFYQELLRGNLRYVASAEPAGRLWQATSAGSMRLTGVALGTTGAVTRLMFSQGAHDASSLPRSVAIKGGPSLRGNEGLVVVGSLGRFFVFGGTTDGHDGGTPRVDAWMLDTAAQAWTRLAMDTSQPPGGILAATYLVEDRAVYFVERVGGVLFIKRWQPLQKHPEGGAVRTLASLPSTWDGFGRFWLVAGSEGDLLFAGAQHADPTKQTLVARFTLDAARRLSFAGQAVILASVTAPSLTASEIGYSTQERGTPRHRSVASSALQIGADRPRILWPR